MTSQKVQYMILLEYPEVVVIDTATTNINTSRFMMTRMLLCLTRYALFEEILTFKNYAGF